MPLKGTTISFEMGKHFLRANFYWTFKCRFVIIVLKNIYFYKRKIVGYFFKRKILTNFSNINDIHFKKLPFPNIFFASKKFTTSCIFVETFIYMAVILHEYESAIKSIRTHTVWPLEGAKVCIASNKKRILLGDVWY